MLLHKSEQLLLGGTQELPDLLPILVNLEGGHGRDASLCGKVLILVNVDLCFLVVVEMCA